MKKDSNNVVNNAPINAITNITGDGFSSLPQHVVTSLFTGSGTRQLLPGATGNWNDLVDEIIYPRLKFKERYMETPEAPFQ